MADSVERIEHRTANMRLHGDYGRYLKWFTAGAIVIHALVLFFLVTPTGEGFEARAEAIEVIELPPEIRIPPPPEEIARPATPVIAEEPIEEDITIAETVIEENEPVPDAPPPVPQQENVGSTYTFTPFTVKPKCETNCTADDVLRHLPAMVSRSGVQCDLTVGLRIDTGGSVTATQILQSSGNSSCDAATEAWAKTTHWTTAYNRDQPVVVWIAQPVTITTE